MAKHEPQQGGWKHTLYGTDQGEWLVGYSSDDTIYANGGDDSADGVHGSDIIDGGDGNDTIIGGTGTDWLTGGLGADHFRMGKGDGVDVVYDFHAEQGDQLWVYGHSNTNYSVTVQDGDTYLNFGGGDQFVLVGITNFDASALHFG